MCVVCVLLYMYINIHVQGEGGGCGGAMIWSRYNMCVLRMCFKYVSKYIFEGEREGCDGCDILM